MQTPRLILVATVGVLLAMSVGVNGWQLPGSNIVTGIVNTTTNAVNDGVHAITDTANSLTDGLTNTVDNTVGSLTNGLENVVGGVVGGLSSALDQIVYRAINDSKLVASALQGYASDIAKKVSNLSIWLTNAARNTLTNLAGNATSLINKGNQVVSNVTSAVDNTLSRINNTLASAYQKAAGYGQNVTDCLTNVTAPVRSAIYDIASAKMNFMNISGAAIMAGGKNASAVVINQLSCVFDPCVTTGATVASQTLRDFANLIDAVAAAGDNLVTAVQQIGNKTVADIESALSNCIAASNSTTA